MEDIDGSSAASSPNGTIQTIAPQYGGGGGGRYHRYSDNTVNHLAFEVGGGFTAPVGNDVNGGFTTILNPAGPNPPPYGTNSYGGNVLGGAGWNFSKRLTLLGEVQYNTSKIPGKTLSEYYNLSNEALGFSASGVTNIGGSVHTLSVTAEPVFNYYASDKHNFGAYVIGGVGYYHKSVNFSAPVPEEDFFGDEFTVNQTFTSYSNNDLGVNLGTGAYFKPFGQYSQAKIFLEARYIFVDSPSQTQAQNQDQNALILNTGTEELIPVTIGLRF